VTGSATYCVCLGQSFVTHCAKPHTDIYALLGQLYRVPRKASHL